MKSLKQQYKEARDAYRENKEDKELKKQFKMLKRKYREAKEDPSKIETKEEPATEKTKRHAGKRKRRKKTKTEEKKTIESSSSSKDELDDTVFVEGIPYDTDDSELRELFETCGPITSLRMPRWHDSGRSRGYAHVQFENGMKSVLAALKMDGHKIGGRYLKIARARAAGSSSGSSRAVHRDHPKGCKTLFVKNLPYDTNESEVSSTFSKFGTVASVRLSHWNHTKNLKGFGYVDFEKAEDCKKAMEASSSVTMKGRSLHLDYESVGAHCKEHVTPKKSQLLFT